MRGPLQLSIELPVSAGTVSRPKKLNVSVSNGFLRLASGDKEKCNRSLANATVTHLGGGRVEIKFEKVAKVRSIKSPRSPFPGKNKFQNSPSLVLFVGEADLEHWLSVLSHADGVLSSSSANSARKTSGENATAMLRYLLEINASQEAFWKENGLKKLLQVLVGPALSAEVTLLASKMLFCQTQRIAKLDIVSFELIQVAARLLAEFSAMSQCSACYILLSVLNVDDGSLGSMSDVLIELKIPRALTNLLVIEEDNLSATLQELILRCLVMMTSRSDLCDSVTGADYLLRFLRICLSLDIDSPLLKLSVQLLGNLSLVSSFREVLADEFNVADVLVSLLSNSTNASLSDALRKSLASVSQHPFMAMQLLQHDRLSRLRRKADGGDAAALWTIIVVANAVAFVDQSLLRALSDVLLQMVSEVTSVTAAEFARLLVLLADRSRDAILLANIKQRNLIDTLRKLGNPEAEFYLAALHLQVHKK